jgi:transcriptional regulator with XRE-family HTH domain
MRVVRPSDPERRLLKNAATRPALADALASSATRESLGQKLRAERERQGIALRELARRLGVSPSLISQIERGLVTPSVGTLWSVTTELGLVMDELFKDAEQLPLRPEQKVEASAERAGTHILRARDRKHIRLAGGVEWQRLTPQPDDHVEFLFVTYGPGAQSCPEDSLFRHDGKEYAYILSGQLGVQIGFERYELGPGDSLSFNSQIPHRLWAVGNEPAVAIWAVVHRA